MSDQAAKNTDRELWREGGGDGDGMSYYQPSIHVTEQRGIGINVGGTVYVRTLTEWHALAGGPAQAQAILNDAGCPGDLLTALRAYMDAYADIEAALDIALAALAGRGDRFDWQARAEAAEQALHEIAAADGSNDPTWWGSSPEHLRSIARAALAGREETGGGG